MLRQALDAAEKGQHAQTVLQPSETDALLPVTKKKAESGYESTQVADDGSELRSSDDEDDAYLLEDEWQDEEGSEVEATDIAPSIFVKVWAAAKSLFFLIVNVENLWDSPNGAHPVEISRRNHYIVLFWFFVLASSYALERSTFKFLVDQSGPFRLFAVEMVTVTHALMIGLGMLISAISRKDFSMKRLGIPIVDVGCK